MAINIAMQIPRKGRPGRHSQVHINILQAASLDHDQPLHPELFEDMDVSIPLIANALRSFPELERNSEQQCQTSQARHHGRKLGPYKFFRARWNATHTRKKPV